MKKRRLMSVLLASALTITSVLPSMAVSAAGDSVEDALVASYDFDDQTLNNSKSEGDVAQAIVTGLNNYTGTVTYGEGRNGGKAVKLGDYGLKLNKQNLGDNFTVSLWLKAEGRIANNQSVMFLGYHNPEKWYAIAGRDSNNGVKMWANGGIYGWTEFGTLPLANDWHSVVITGDSENITTYFDGVAVTSNETNHPLAGTNQDIYLGVTYWDPEFTGYVDDVKVYNTTLTEEQVQAEDKEYYESVLQEKVDAVSADSLLGLNDSADAVEFDLVLPETMANGAVTWTSSNEAVIATDGTVKNPDEDAQVTLTATVKAGSLTATREFTFTVKAIDRTDIDALIAKAESLDTSKYTEESAAELADALEEAKAAASNAEVKAAVKNLHSAIAGLTYMEEYSNPFAAIDAAAPAASKEMAVGDSEQLFTLPDSVKDNVTVEYFSSDEESATYADGKVTALKDGRVTVTAIVTAKSNGYKEEYSTALNISDADAAEAQAVQTAEASDGPLTIKESEINQLLTEDLELPTQIDGKDADITYSVGNADSSYVKVEGSTLKVTRPYAGEGNYAFTLTATVKTADGTVTQEFPLTIAEGTSADTYAGYVYVCFGNVGGADVQQLHMFLSEDGLNWTALNGFNPVFEVGTDYADLIQNAGTHNYTIKSGTDITKTVSGDASVLFPFEGDDQGIRDPYVLRGSREEDKNKVWILATDLNTMSSQYGGNLSSNRVGNWGTMSSAGSTSIFVYETEDWVHWERRYIDVGSEIDAGAAWAPEAVYNPEKDNYLVYWSCRVGTDGYARNRLYCNETTDFKTFGPTKMYEEEAFYQKWGQLVNANDGYGNIDTSQLWVADEDGNPYGTLYRLVKDETNNHIELMSADTVLDPDVDYDNTDPKRITPYTKNGKEYAALADLAGLNDFEKADIVWNWFKNESTGNHFEYISQKNMEAKSGAYEGATMFKFNDRDEWCVMIDFYGNNSVRYEPYTTTDLSKADSITKVSSGYGRTGGDVGCHGGMMPITVEEYNTLIDTYNADSSVDNYHQIDYIECDKRELEDTVNTIKKALEDENISDAVRKELEASLIKAESMMQMPTVDSDEVAALTEVLDAAEITVSDEKVSSKTGESKEVTATIDAEGVDLTWNSADEKVATVENGKITAVGGGSTFVFVRAGRTALAKVQVTVTEPSVTSITVKTAPEKTEYKIGEELDLSGIAIEATYDDGTKKEIDIKDCTVTGFDNTKAGTQKITVTYEEQTVTFEVTVSTKAVSDIFDDVDSEDWFNDYVQNVYDKEIMTGLTPTHFGPTDTLARAQFALMLYRMEGEPEVTTTTAAFPDAGESWYKDAVIWANQNKIITGYTDSGLFGPADPITREQMATIMYRYANYKKWDVTKSADLSTFPDASSVSAYAKDAMAWAVANEIIQGNNGRLDPQGSAVRAQAATIISRFIAIYPVFE